MRDKFIKLFSKAHSEFLQINRFHRYLSSLAPIQYHFEQAQSSFISHSNYIHQQHSARVSSIGSQPIPIKVD